MKYRVLFLIIIAAACSMVTAGQSRVVVRFVKGSHAASMTGSVKGYNYVDYVLNAREGQTMDVKLTSTKGNAEIVLFDPNDENVESAAGVAEYNGVLAMSGNYKVRVLLPRSEARRSGSGTAFTIKFTIR